jgi:hypothetical protein
MVYSLTLGSLPKYCSTRVLVQYRRRLRNSAAACRAGPAHGAALQATAVMPHANLLHYVQLPLLLKVVIGGYTRRTAQAVKSETPSARVRSPAFLVGVCLISVAIHIIITYLSVLKRGAMVLQRHV